MTDKMLWCMKRNPTSAGQSKKKTKQKKKKNEVQY